VGVDILILGGLKRGTFSVAREWTDRADLYSYELLGLPPLRFDADLLLNLVDLLKQLAEASPKESPLGD
jgi:hypothetical protein